MQTVFFYLPSRSQVTMPDQSERQMTPCLNVNVTVFFFFWSNEHNNFVIIMAVILGPLPVLYNMERKQSLTLVKKRKQ